MSRDWGRSVTDRHDDASALATLAEPEDLVGGTLKVSGAARFAGDGAMPGMLWARFLGSTRPHARIRSVDATRARSMPGVRAVLTGEDARGIRFGRRLQDQPVIAWDTARFVGDRLAAVAADTPEQAEAARLEIDVDLEELPAIFDARTALLEGAPILHPDARDYIFLGGDRPPVSHPNLQSSISLQRGESDLAPIFARAAFVFEDRFTTPRQHHGAVEPHATLVWIADDRQVHVRSTNKDPFALRAQMARTFGLPEDRIAIESSFIGGDFGGKGYSTDEYACYLLAVATGRPIKAITPHADEVAAVNVRHAAEIRLRTAVDADGNLLAHEAEILFDGGAYASAKAGANLIMRGATATLAAYRVPNVRIDVRIGYSNTVPAGSVRAPGEFQALFAGESHLDGIARALGRDPLAFRIQNAVRPGEVGSTGSHFPHVRAEEALRTIEREMDWRRPRPVGNGLGVAMGARHFSGGKLELQLRIHHDGRLDILTGLPDQGAGAWTVIRRVFATCASIDESRVSVVHVATDRAPLTPSVGGSKTTHLASRAAENLAEGLRTWIDERLPGAIPLATPEVTLRDDRYVDLSTGRVVAGFDDVVGALIGAQDVIELSALVDSSDGTRDDGGYSFCATSIEVRVDRATGEVKIVDALVVADVGTIINPNGHRGQLEGGFAFGYGAAMMEGLSIDQGIITTPTLADMKLPVAGDLPALRIVELPRVVGPGAFGAKGAGEFVNATVAPAIANAIADAVGVRVRELPISAERILAAIVARDTGVSSP
jgi:carbon-monoxide dehydrogenase large subunit